MKKLFLLLVFFVCNYMYGQIILQDETMENYKYEIKQLNDFFERFNLQRIVVTPMQSDDFKTANRILLFDKDTYLKNKELADEMIELIEKDSINIHFEDTIYYAQLKCNCSFQKKEQEVELLLKVQNIQDDLYKWVIYDAKGDFLTLQPTIKSEHFIITPAQNEVNFIALTEISQNNNRNIMQYMYDGFESDQLSVLNTLIYYGLLKINTTISLTYHFNLNNKFEFSVAYFNRNSKNSGWLINDIVKL